MGKKVKKKGETKEVAGPKKPKIRSVLDPNEAKNIGIAISMLWKGDWNEFAQAVRALDTRKITPEGVEKLAKVMPSSGAMKAQLADKGDRSNMNKADKFVLALANVNKDNRLKARVESMLFQIEFPSLLKQTDQQVTKIHQACMQVQDGKRLPEILGIILVVGNKLNQNQKNQDSSAIRLKDLKKIAETKNNKGETMLEYVVKNLLRKQPDSLQVSRELGAVPAASKVNMDVTKSDIKKLQKGLDMLEREFEKDEQVGDDYFETSLGPFRDKAMIRFEHLQEKYEATMEAFKVVGEFLLEPQLSPEELFSMLNNFLSLVNITTKKVSAKEERMAKMAKAKAKKEARKKAKKAAAAAGKS